jgi:putative spermidine/putrescine transport system substrate-binding protein
VGTGRPNGLSNDRLSRRRLLAVALGYGAVCQLLQACQPRAASPGPGPAATEPPPARPAPTPEHVPPTQVAPGGARPFAGQSVAVRIWSGPFAQVIRDTVKAGFEAEHGVNLTIREGMPADQMATLREERAAPRHIVMGLDDLSANLARREGLVSPLDPTRIPHLADVYPEYLLEDGHAVAQGANWITVWYNSQKLGDPPASYQAFWEPKLKGRVAVPSIGLTTGLLWLVMAAALESGRSPFEAQQDVEPGFARWKQLKPNLHSTFENFGESVRLLAQGEIWLTFGHSRQAAHLIAKGAPIERAPVREGAFLGSNAMVLVKHPTLEPLGRDLIDRILAPGPQSELARLTLTGPASRRATVPGELGRLAPVGPDAARSLIRLDWSHLDRHRAAWVERWQQEIGG